mgnify:CR=1 FL=1
MNPKFNLLRINANKRLPEIGYDLIEENESRSEFHNINGLRVIVVDQRYDPPECWIGKVEESKYIRIGFIAEFYLDNKLSILKKYVSNDGLKFNYTEMSYYIDFINEYEKTLLAMDDFATTINEWSKSKDFNIEKIKNAI